jgi:hypothetical protein
VCDCAERTVGAMEHPGSMQQMWNADGLENKFYVTFSDAGKEEIRKSVMRRLSNPMAMRGGGGGGGGAPSSSVSSSIPETHSAAERELDALIDDAAGMNSDLVELDSLIESSENSQFSAVRLFCADFQKEKEYDFAILCGVKWKI